MTQGSDRPLGDGSDRSPRLITRRRFIAYAGAGTAATMLVDSSFLSRAYANNPYPDPFVPPAPGTPLGIVLRRPDDLVALGFEFYNLVLNNSTPANPVLVPIDPSQPSWVVVVFPPQSLAERAELEDDSGAPAPDEAPFPSILAHVSLLAFQIPGYIQSIPFTSQGLLEWSQWIPSIVPWAASTGHSDVHHAGTHEYANGYPLIRTPTPVETQLEMPWRLILSPNETSGWAHSTVPVTHNGLTELWHTRLGTARPDGTVDETPGGTKTVRAIYAGDPAFPANQLNHSSPPAPNETPPGPGQQPAFPQGEDPFLAAMYAVDRYNLVENTSDYYRATGNPAIGQQAYLPTPVQDIERLMLSPLGGWMDLTGTWDNDVTGLVEWRQRATLGRDHYVKLVYKGYLMPTGHPAVFVEETQRKFEASATTGTINAVLRKREFIIVRQPVKYFGDQSQGAGAFGSQYNQRAWPLRKVEIKTVVTPDIFQSQYIASLPVSTGHLPFVPTTNQNGQLLPFHFHLVSTDWSGTEQHFTTPMVFVYEPDALGLDSQGLPNTQNITLICQQYNQQSSADPGNQWWGTPDDIKVRPFNGQKVNYAEVLKPNQTVLQTDSITWGVEPPSPGLTPTQFDQNDQPQFYPVVRQANVTFQAAQQIHGGGPIAGSPITIYGMDTTGTQQNAYGGPAPTGGYALHAFDPAANQGQAYVGLVDGGTGALSKGNGVPLAFGADNSGGVVTPSLTISGLSRSNGIVAGDIDAFANGTFDPVAFFLGNTNPKILGGIHLSDVIEAVLDLAGVSPKSVMSIVSHEIHPPAPPQPPNVPPLPSLPTAIDVTLDWQPNLQADPANVFQPHDDASADISGLIHIDLQSPASSTWSVNGYLRRFDVNLFGSAIELLVVHFNELSFSSAKGQKPKVNVDIASVDFEGPLKFVEQLEDVLKSFGVGGGVSIDITPTQVSASLTVPIPSISVGVFALKNLSFSSEFIIPFSGNPARARFGFSSRDNPFQLTVCLFSGGGFFGIAFGLDGFEMMEASFEFGASISIDIGIASGGIHAYAGIYFSLTKEQTGTNIELIGYFRMGGGITVLGGLAAVSVEVYLGLVYDSIPNRVAGQASFTVSVSLFWFKFSHTFGCEKHFGGSGADPTFLQEIPDVSTWTTYTGAFAPIGA
jgi:hypothetical protein